MRWRTIGGWGGAGGIGGALYESLCLGTMPYFFLCHASLHKNSIDDAFFFFSHFITSCDSSTHISNIKIIGELENFEGEERGESVRRALYKSVCLGTMLSYAMRHFTRTVLMTHFWFFFHI